MNQERDFHDQVKDRCYWRLAGPLKPSYNFDRYDGELRRPVPSVPQFAPDSNVWRREHGVADAEPAAAPGHNTVRTAATGGVAA